MRRRTLGVLVGIGLCTTLVAWAGPASAASSLLKNGGFEKPVVAPGGFVPVASGSTFSHWKVGGPGDVAVASGTFVEGGFSFPAKAGAQWLDLTGSLALATRVSQSFASEPGTPYTVSFAVGNVNNPSGPYGTTSTVKLLVDGAQVLRVTNTKGSGSSMVWKTYSFTFLATGGTTTLAFVNGDPPGDTANGLDAVKLGSAPTRARRTG
jgi:hypothetical protein